MTYLQFHLAFTLPVLAALAALQRPPLAGVGPRALVWLGAVTALAVAYTTPWDNYLVWRGVWGYPEGAVLGTLGVVPVEEYAFFVIQTLIVGLWTFLLRARDWAASPERPMPRGWRPGGAALGLGLTALGVGLLLHPSDRVLYLGLILAWASPVVAGMLWIGADRVWAERRRLALAIAVPTLYLWVIDRIAIGLGIWDIRDRYSLGLDPLGLPVEEGVFFLMTTALCAVGLVLFLPPTDAVRR